MLTSKPNFRHVLSSAVESAIHLLHVGHLVTWCSYSTCYSIDEQAKTLTAVRSV
jgi:hypothetical protein